MGSHWRPRVAAITAALTSAALGAAAAPALALDVDVTAAPYSARGDGTTNDRLAIQSALNAVATAGGGTVTIPAGRTFLTGSISIGDDVTLRVDGTLKQSQNGADYAATQLLDKYIVHRDRDVPYDATWFRNQPFVHADGSDNVTVTGSGKILMTRHASGQASTIYAVAIGFLNTTNYTIENVHIDQAGAYNVAVYGTRRGVVRNLEITATNTWNTDGISVVNTQDLRVTGNTMTVKDDGMYAVTRINDPRDYDPTAWFTRRNLQPTQRIEFDNNWVYATEGFMMRPTINGVADLRQVATTDVWVHDNYLRSRDHDPVGCWPDNEPAPLERFRIVGNTYVDDTPTSRTNQLSSCRITDFENDLGATSATQLQNGDFEATGAAWWSPVGDAGAVPVGSTTLVPAARTASAAFSGHVGYVQNLGTAAELKQGIGTVGGNGLPGGMVLPTPLAALFPNPAPYRLSADMVTSGHGVRLVAYDSCTRRELGSVVTSVTVKTRVTLTFPITAVCGLVRVGVDRGTATAGWALIDDVRLARGGGEVIDDASRAIAYTGTWTPFADSADDVFGTRMVGRVRGATATIPFTGTRAWIAGLKNAGLGIFEVWLDGRLVTTVDTYATSLQRATVLYDTGVLSAGAHTLRIVQTGTKNAASTGILIGLDAVLVDPGP